MKLKALLFIATVILIGTTGGLLYWLKSNQKLGTPGVRLELPVNILDYQSVAAEITPLERTNLPPDTSFARRQYYRVTNGVTNNYIQLGIVLMGTDRTSIHKPEYCLTGQGWRIDQSEELAISMPRPLPYNLPVMRIISNSLRRFPQPDGSFKDIALKGLYVYWFVDENRLTARHRQRMWWMAEDLLKTGVLHRWAYVSCFAVCLPGQEESAYQEVSRFITAAVPEFQTAYGAGTDAAGNEPVLK
jgi:hypothetical protein